jgi:NAD(P)-dependent dehydrogenase (short-subunit alcohol dehydrogenase family)
MTKNPFSLTGKIVMVTGASSGIGKVISIECSKLGAKLVLTGRDEQRLKNTFENLEGSGHKYIVADIRNTDDLKYLIDSSPMINGLVHSAGIVKTMPIGFISTDALNSIMDINFKGPVLLTQGLMKTKKIVSGGSIVIISSISGIACALSGNGVYSASKGAITSMAKIMALEFASQKIRVNSILAGMVKTHMTDGLLFSEDEIIEDIKKYPLGYGEPDDVALGVVYLLSDASKWITGTDLKMDGGYTLS